MTLFLRTPLLLSGLLASLCACAQTPATPTPANDYPVQVSLAGKTYTLGNEEQRCTLLKPDHSALPLDMPWPCHFSVGSDGKAHVETYKNVPIVIVLHVMPIAQNSLECRSEYRALRLNNEQLEPSVIARSASCLRGTGDQKDYTALFDW